MIWAGHGSYLGEESFENPADTDHQGEISEYETSFDLLTKKLSMATADDSDTKTSTDLIPTSMAVTIKWNSKGMIIESPQISSSSNNFSSCSSALCIVPSGKFHEICKELAAIGESVKGNDNACSGIHIKTLINSEKCREICKTLDFIGSKGGSEVSRRIVNCDHITGDKQHVGKGVTGDKQHVGKGVTGDKQHVGRSVTVDKQHVGKGVTGDKQHVGKGVKCGICKEVLPVSSSAKGDLDQHSRLAHNGLMMVQCMRCPKTFNNFSQLRDHTARKHRLQIMCPICNKLISKIGYKGHLRVHDSNRKTFTCQTCRKIYRDKEHFKRHCQVHAGELESSCEICSKRFLSNSRLKLHMVCHSSEEAYCCDNCGLRFCLKGRLVDHQKTHNQDKKFQCNECGKWFRSKRVMKNHIMATHLNAREYKCSTCSMRFNGWTPLKHHELIHMDIKPHKCDFCQKTFRISSTLKVHLRIHTGELPYTCKYCPKSFACWPNLNKHCRRMHFKQFVEEKTSKA